MNYYNEFDDGAAAWLKELIARGLIPDGYVDSRDIRTVTPGDLAGFTQCHFFAGIGGWPLALSLAGWPADKPVWTGSCPCQPFSAAGKRKGTADDRHLWPDFANLTSVCRPTTIFGEQVASKDGRTWLASVRDELEAMGYAVGAADLCAPGAGAFHIRQRLFFGARRLAVTNSRECERVADGQGRERYGKAGGRQQGDGKFKCCATASGLGDAYDTGPQGRISGRNSADERAFRSPSMASGMEHAASNGRQQGRAKSDGREFSARRVLDTWQNPEWLECTDGKARPIKPGTFPLAYGIPGRVGRLRGYGNAIVPQVAAIFIEAFQESWPAW